MQGLLGESVLPTGFEYPPGFLRAVDAGLTNFEPWWIIEGEKLRLCYLGLRDRYTDRVLVPFAARQDNDDLACWDLARGTVVVIHDFAAPGFEQRAELPDFAAWLRLALEAFIDFE
jgi:hypothetical protein